MPKENLSQFITESDQEKLNHELIAACKSGNLTRTQAALAKGADLLYWEQDCLSKAVRGGHVAIVRYLIKSGADINLYNGLLSDATRHEQAADMIDLLISHDIYLGKEQNHLMGAMITAMHKGQKENFLHLLNLPVLHKDNTPVFQIVKFSNHGETLNISENSEFFTHDNLMTTLIKLDFALVNDFYGYSFFHDNYEKYAGEWIYTYFEKIESNYTHDIPTIMNTPDLPRFHSYFLHNTLTQDFDTDLPNTKKQKL